MKDIKLKKSWSEVTLAEYDKIMEICYNEDLSEAEKDVALIALLCGKTEDEIWQMPLEDIKFLKIDLMFLTNDFNYPKTLSFKKLKIGDWELEIIPDLQKMTYAQFVDYQTYIRETDKTGSAPKNKAAILSCFFIPKGKKYNDGYDLMELQRVLKDNVSMVKEFIKQFSNLFGLETEGAELDDEEEQSNEGKTKGTGEEGEGTSAFAWLTMLKQVSDLTHFDFDKCWMMGIYEFFNYLAFNNDLNRKKEEMMKKEMAKIKNKR